MTNRQYSSSDALPILKKDTLYLYGNRTDPYTQRARLVLHHKNIPYEAMSIKLDDKPIWFTQKSPNKTTPVLEINEKVLRESDIIMDYLDEGFIGPKLTPTDPYIKAKGRIIGEEFKKVISHFYKVLKGSAIDRPAAIQTFFLQLETFENYLPDTKFFNGEEVSMVDYFCWPWAERMPVLDRFFQLNVITEERCPKLQAWVSAMEETPGVKATRICTEEYCAFYEQYNPMAADMKTM